MPDNTDVVRRQDFIRSLQGLYHDARESPYAHRAADARRQLAQLRHSLLPGRQHHGYEVVFRRPSQPAEATGSGKDQPHEWLPSEDEQEVWLLVGGLFALHPQPWRRRGPQSLGASMGLLDIAHVGSAARRFTQLLGRGRDTLPHHLRQAIRLLAGRDIPVHYGQLLDDLVVLLGPAHAGKPAARVRLRWAREFHMPATAEPAGGGPNPTDDAPNNSETIQ